MAFFFIFKSYFSSAVLLEHELHASTLWWRNLSVFFFFFFNRLELRRLKSIVSTVLKKIFMFTMASQKCPGYKIGFTFLTHQKKKIQLIWLAHTKCSFKQALNFNTRWPKTIATRLQRLLCHLAQTPGK